MGSIAIRKIIIDWIGTINSNVPVVRLYQNSPRPEEAYFGIYIPEVDSIDDDYFSNDSVGDDFTIFNTDEFNLQLSHYGENSFDIMKNTTATLESKIVQADFTANGLVYVDREKVVDATRLIDGMYEESSSCTIRFRLGNSIVDSVGYFDKVEVGDNEVISPDGAITNLGKINIP